MKKLFKWIYKTVPFKREIFSLLKRLWIPPKTIYQHLHFVGVINVRVNKSDAFKMKHHGYQLENEIFWNGLTQGWEKQSIQLWIKLCRNSAVTLDIGANTGLYALIAKTLNRKGKVFAFEPVQRVYNKLNENIALNNFDIVAVRKAASNKNGSALIYDTPSEHIYSVAVNKNLNSSDTKVIETKIETVTLDQFVADNHISKIDLMKIDVETHEPEVLEGYKNHLAIHRPTILIEVLTDEIAAKIEAAVNGLGYFFFNIDEDGGIRQVSKITASDYFNYLLCSKVTAEELGLVSLESRK